MWIFYDKNYKEGINSILDENGYPELSVRVRIDVGENAAIRYASINDYANNKEKYDTNTCRNKYNLANKDININSMEKFQLDILGHTINTASKMTQFAKPNRIIIGNAVYNKLDTNKKSNFKKIHIDNELWNYIDNSNGNIYDLYCN